MRQKNNNTWLIYSLSSTRHLLAICSVLELDMYWLGLNRVGCLCICISRQNSFCISLQRMSDKKKLLKSQNSFDDNFNFKIAVYECVIHYTILQQFERIFYYDLAV